MTNEQAAIVRAAYRAARDALEKLRQALDAAGLSDEKTDPPAVELVASDESIADRRRRLARERTSRWRASRSVTDERHRDSIDSVTASPKSVTVTSPSVTERHRDAPPASRARAFLFSEDISPPVCYANIPPLTTEEPVGDGDGVTLAKVDPPAAPVEVDPPADPTSPAAPGSPARKRKAQERPALRPGSTIDVSVVSPPVPGSDRAPAGPGGGPASDRDRVWSAYLEAVAPTRPRLTPPRSALIDRRLRDYSVDELERSIRGYGRSSFHRGDNDRGRPYQAIELWLRDAAHIEAGWGYLDAQPTVRKPSRAGLNLDGINDPWAEYESRLAAEKAEVERDVFAEHFGVEQRP